MSTAPVWYLNNLLRSDQRKMLFICGHMRSGSSLLLHILNTNPDIIGFGELHMRYHSVKDFGKASYKIMRSFNAVRLREYYVLDKVLHTRLMPDQRLLNHAKTVFIVRRPGEALSSMLKLTYQETSDNPEGAYQYYVKRLRWIAEASETLEPDVWTYTTYRELIRQPAAAFLKMEQLLSLKNPLSGDYNTTWATGKKGIGDSGSKIGKGEILKNKKRKIDDRIVPYLNKAEEEYEKCLHSLTENS